MFIVYIKNPFWEKITQIFNISSLRIKQKLNDISFASFELFISDKNANYENFQEFNKVEIYKQENNQEKLLFSWVVKNIEANLEKIKVSLNDDVFLLKKKKIYWDTNYVNTSIKDILSDILSKINTRNDSGIVLDCQITETVSKEYKNWKDFLEVLKDLAKNGYEFTVKDWTLIFTNSIGKDKTTWSDFVEFLFDKDNIESNNIGSAKSLYDSSNIANAIIVKDSWNTEDTTSIETYWRIEEFFSSWEKNSILNERKNSIRELEINPSNNDFFIADIWDLVNVYINTGSDLLFHNGHLKIIEKELVSWELNKVNIKLSSWNIKSLQIVEKIAEMDGKIKNLEL